MTEGLDPTLFISVSYALGVLMIGGYQVWLQIQKTKVEKMAALFNDIGDS